MKWFTRSIVFPLAVVFFPQLSALANNSMINIVFIGDSITEGVGVNDSATQSAPVMCIQALQKKLPNSVIYFSNQGHAGHTTTDFLPAGGDITALEAAVKQLTVNHAGQLVFSIMLGTNDSANSGPNGAPVTDSVYHDNLKKTIDRLLAEFPDSKFVIHNPIWYSPNTHNGADYEGKPAADRLKSYFLQIDALVAEYNASKPNHVFRGDTLAYDYFSSHFKTELNAEDGHNGWFYLHPNAIGAKKLAEFWANALTKDAIK